MPPLSLENCGGLGCSAHQESSSSIHPQFMQHLLVPFFCSTAIDFQFFYFCSILYLRMNTLDSSHIPLSDSLLTSCVTVQKLQTHTDRAENSVHLFLCLSRGLLKHIPSSSKCYLSITRILLQVPILQNSTITH